MSKVSVWLRRKLGLPEVNVTQHPLYPLLQGTVTQAIARQVVGNLSEGERNALEVKLAAKRVWDTRTP